MPTERFVEALGSRVRIVEEGAGEPVLLVHGLGGWAENWAPTMADLAAAGRRAIACDLPGYGQSSPPRDRVRYFDPPRPYYADFLAALLDTLGLARVDLVGNSLGGAIAVATALTTPERVRRLVLISPGGFGQRLAFLFRLGTLPFLEALAPATPRFLVRRFMLANFHDPSRCPSWLVDDAYRYTRGSAGREVVRVLRQVATPFGQREDMRRAWEDRLGELVMPTLVIWGRQDRVLPVAHAERAFRLLPNARLELIDGAGHLVTLERPREVAEALLPFLEAA